jgi:hypothetical protein
MHVADTFDFGRWGGLLAGLIGIGGGIVIVPVVFYELNEADTSPDQAAHVAVGTLLGGHRTRCTRLHRCALTGWEYIGTFCGSKRLSWLSAPPAGHPR